MLSTKQSKKLKPDGSGLTPVLQLAEENAALLEISRLTSSSLNLDEIYRMVSIELGKLIPYDRLSFSVVDYQRGTAITAYATGQVASGWSVGTVARLDETLAGRIVRSKMGEIIQGNDLRAAPDSHPALSYGLVSRMTVPLIHGGEASGNLTVRSRQINAYTQQHLELAERIAAQNSGTIALAQLDSRLSVEIERRKQAHEVMRLREQQARETAAESAPDAESSAYANSRRVPVSAP